MIKSGVNNHTSELINSILDKRLEYFHKLSYKGQVRYKRKKYFRGFGPVCQGCEMPLVVGDSVYSFRKNNFVHSKKECLKSLSPFRITKELKTLLNRSNE